MSPKVNVGDLIITNKGKTYEFTKNSLSWSDDFPYFLIDLDTHEVVDSYPVGAFEKVGVGYELPDGDIIKEIFPLEESETAIKIPEYPDEFFDYSNGFDFSDGIVNQWIKELIDELEDNHELHSSARSSGNTYIQVNRLSEEDGKYEILVSKSHHKAYID